MSERNATAAGRGAMDGVSAATHHSHGPSGIRVFKVDAELKSGTPVSGIAEVALRVVRDWWRTRSRALTARACWDTLNRQL